MLPLWRCFYNSMKYHPRWLHLMDLLISLTVVGEKWLDWIQRARYFASFSLFAWVFTESSSLERVEGYRNFLYSDLIAQTITQSSSLERAEENVATLIPRFSSTLSKELDSVKVEAMRSLWILTWLSRTDGWCTF